MSRWRGRVSARHRHGTLSLVGEHPIILHYWQLSWISNSLSCTWAHHCSFHLSAIPNHITSH
uniref:Uncharacterized protein n=1 Tax=Anguilla anguilla TaxID=7936 RepID=A0A0E9X0Q3_ANGAN